MKTVTSEKRYVSSGAKPPESRAPLRPIVMDRVYALVVVIALVAGVGLRVVRLAEVPPGLHHDEACDGYDAYSILETGRDHHGNFLPFVMQGFNDYRMPLFQYSLVPLVAVFGLKPTTVRLGAALWGVADLIAITLLAWLILGWPGAVAAALFGALSPWHLPFSRYGSAWTAASATITIAMLCFFLWLRRHRDWWLVASGVFFGLSLYSYAITKAFTPLLMVLLVVLYRRELREAWAKALGVAAIVIVFALPQALLLVQHAAEMQARFNMQWLLNWMPSHSLLYQLMGFAANWASYFTPSFLFLIGDRGDHWTMVHPPGFGELLPEQAPLVVLGLAAIAAARHRRAALLLAGWLLFASLPAALTMPDGAWYPEAREIPTPDLRFDYSSVPAAPLTPSLLLAHPDSHHDALAMAPWILLSALGFVVLLEWTSRVKALQAAAAGLILAGIVFHGVRFVRYYFREFPAVAAPYFQYGIEQAMQAVDKLDDGTEPIVITARINQPYIYVLFFERYPPARFQSGRVERASSLYGSVFSFDRYMLVSPEFAYPRLRHGIFVLAPTDKLPQAPALSVRYPDGSLAYSVVVK